MGAYGLVEAVLDIHGQREAGERVCTGKIRGPEEGHENGH
jgi:hypothetical protein